MVLVNTRQFRVLSWRWPVSSVPDSCADPISKLRTELFSCHESTIATVSKNRPVAVVLPDELPTTICLAVFLPNSGWSWRASERIRRESLHPWVDEITSLTCRHRKRKKGWYENEMPQNILSTNYWPTRLLPCAHRRCQEHSHITSTSRIQCDHCLHVLNVTYFCRTAATSLRFDSQEQTLIACRAENKSMKRSIPIVFNDWFVVRDLPIIWYFVVAFSVNVPASQWKRAGTPGHFRANATIAPASNTCMSGSM